MSLAAIPGLFHGQDQSHSRRSHVPTYTFDVFSSLDGFGGISGGDWGGYWGKQGPELLDHRVRPTSTSS